VLLNTIASEIDLRDFHNLIEDYGMLTNDIIIAVSTEKNNIKAIVTFDEDIKRVPWLKVIP
jgi:predicted nucleic acid-binding protein